MAKDYPQISLSTLVIMPDHLHGIVRVTEHMEKPIGVPLRAFKSQVTSALRKRQVNPELQVSRRIEPEALAALREEMLDCVRNGGVLVSPFISPGEKEISRAALDAGGSVILMKPDGFPPYFKPHGKYFDLCLQGRLLILACRPPSTGATTVTRELCLAMNHWCQQIGIADAAKPL